MLAARIQHSEVQMLHIACQSPSDDRQCHANHGSYQTDQPETLHDLSLAPTRELKMMVQRCHLKQTLPFTVPPLGVFEVRGLDHDAERIAERYQADDWQEWPLAGHQTDHR